MRTISTQDFQESHPQWNKARKEITYYPIGFVETEFNHALPKALLEASNQCRIILHPDYEEGLKGLAIGRRLRVFYHNHLSRGFNLLRNPHGGGALSQKGLFGIESLNRPNPVDFSDVELLALGDHVLWVKGLYVVDGTPVLDIKPVPIRKIRPVSKPAFGSR